MRIWEYERMRTWEYENMILIFSYFHILIFSYSHILTFSKYRNPICSFGDARMSVWEYENMRIWKYENIILIFSFFHAHIFPHSHTFIISFSHIINCRARSRECGYMRILKYDTARPIFSYSHTLKFLHRHIIMRQWEYDNMRIWKYGNTRKNMFLNFIIFFFSRILIFSDGNDNMRIWKWFSYFHILVLSYYHILIFHCLILSFEYENMNVWEYSCSHSRMLSSPALLAQVSDGLDCRLRPVRAANVDAHRHGQVDCEVLVHYICGGASIIPIGIHFHPRRRFHSAAYRQRVQRPCEWSQLLSRLRLESWWRWVTYPLTGSQGKHVRFWHRRLNNWIGQHLWRWWRMWLCLAVESIWTMCKRLWRRPRRREQRRVRRFGLRKAGLLRY